MRKKKWIKVWLGILGIVLVIAVVSICLFNTCTTHYTGQIYFSRAWSPVQSANYTLYSINWTRGIDEDKTIVRYNEKEMD